jgi:hypothetical protein
MDSHFDHVMERALRTGGSLQAVQAILDILARHGGKPEGTHGVDLEFDADEYGEPLVLVIVRVDDADEDNPPLRTAVRKWREDVRAAFANAELGYRPMIRYESV